MPKAKSQVAMNLSKTTKRMVRYDAPETDFPPDVQNIYIEKAAFQDYFSNHGSFPSEIIVTVSY